ncbi:hypothetical protein VCHA27O13_160102 [Vibrio chagasii]|nr:hypothetical protein VCHA27O13_160102 [Vibrio chagasii]
MVCSAKSITRVQSMVLLRHFLIYFDKRSNSIRVSSFTVGVFGMIQGAILFDLESFSIYIILFYQNVYNPFFSDQNHQHFSFLTQ